LAESAVVGGGGDVAGFRFLILSHPNEFLRSTSSARVSAAVLGAACEVAAVGCAAHEARVREALAPRDPAAPPPLILYPMEPGPDTDGNAGGGGGAKTVLGALGCVNMGRGLRSGVGAVTTVVVPDGSARNALALAREAARVAAEGGRTATFAALDADAVARNDSPLIDALHPGSGKGRVSTLEAMASFLREAAAGGSDAAAAMEAAAAALHLGLDALIARMRSSQSAVVSPSAAGA
jgi:hypothetical protein